MAKSKAPRARKSSGKLPLQRVARVRLPLEDARNLLLEGSTVATWFGAERANIEPKVGGKYEIFWVAKSNGDSTKGCKIQSLGSDSLVIQWAGPTQHAKFKGMENPGDTTVSFQLISDGDSTVIRIEHSGLDAIADAEAAERYYSERWKIWANNLEMMGALAGKFRAVNSVVRGLQGKTAPVLEFAPPPGGGARARFDFSKISLDTNAIFGNNAVLRNLVDQA